jgi:poly-gamma-glutamate capsule biosynthesis protein CapA/YwtB (metallophosphatase superfamily)
MRSRSTSSLLSDGGAPRHGAVARWITTSAVGVLTASLLASPVAAQQAAPKVETEVTHESTDYPSGPPYSVLTQEGFPYRDVVKELQNKTTGTYTVVATGDVFWKYPVAARMSPQLRDLLRNADTTVGNMEGGMMSPFSQDRAKDLADMGFDLLANGEDDSVAGYEARAKYLAPLGIKVAGAGLNLTEARLPVFQETPKGMAAFLSACPGIDLCGDSATNATDRRPARAGVNQLGLTVWNTVTAEQLKQLQAIRDSILARRTEPHVLVPSADPPAEKPGRLVLFGQNYMVADKPGNIHYELEPASEQRQILDVRNAKEFADFVVYHMHDHHNRYSFQHYTLDNYPVDYMQPFLHKLIDNGLDMYVGSGNHTMQGIEIYKGRPIFYNLGNLGRDTNRTHSNPPGGGSMTGTERLEQGRNPVSWNDIASSAYIANSTYKDGRLVEIRLYPVDIGLGERPWSREHIPNTPSPERARLILARLQKFSEPFGTKISIENNIGIIRVPPEATVEVGGDIAIPGRGRGTAPFGDAPPPVKWRQN